MWGPHDYVISSWYAPGDPVPTWHHITVHLYRTPEILGDEKNYAMVFWLTDHSEKPHPNGRNLSERCATTTTRTDVRPRRH